MWRVSPLAADLYIIILLKALRAATNYWPLKQKELLFPPQDLLVRSYSLSLNKEPNELL